MHRRIGHPNDYWSFTIIWRRISHCHSILSRTSNASDGQIATLTDLGRPNRNLSRVRIQPLQGAIESVGDDRVSGRVCGGNGPGGGRR
jgi:hypothetical protein